MPYVIRVEAPGGVSTGYTDYRKPVQIEIPPVGEVIDVSALRSTGN